MPAKTTYEVKGSVRLEQKEMEALDIAGVVAKNSKSGKANKHARKHRAESDSSSDDSDTDECYQPLGMEAWRWASHGSGSIGDRRTKAGSGHPQYEINVH